MSKEKKHKIQIDLTTTDKSTRKEIMDRLYGMGYKWNNGFLSINVGKTNKFWKSYKDGNYITDLDYIIIGPYMELKQNEIGHNGRLFSNIDIIKPDEFLNYSVMDSEEDKVNPNPEEGEEDVLITDSEEPIEEDRE